MKKQFVTLGGLAVAVVTCVALSGGGSATAASQIDGSTIKKGTVTGDKLASQTITSDKIAKDGVGTSEIRDGSVTSTDLDPALAKKINGSDQVVAVTAQTMLTDRDDSGHGGLWAKDSFTRILAIQRQGRVASENCGGGSDVCWFYTATTSDNGSFKTVTGGKSPRQGTTINGTVVGTIQGTGEFEFYSTVAVPDSSKVPSAAGNGPETGTWPSLAFPANSTYGMQLKNYSFTYAAAKTCEQWVETNKNNDGLGDTGDIQGVNKCNG